MKATPGTVNDIIITEDNTVNGTASPVKTQTNLSSGNGSFQISITNNMGASGVNAYITGRNAAGSVVFLSPQGGWYYPDPHGSAAPVQITDDVKLPLGGAGSSSTFALPGYLSAARVWIAEGELDFFTVASNGIQLVEPSFANPKDPSTGINWGFVELTYLAEGLWANLSFVDFVGLVMGMTLTLGSGEVQTRKGLRSDAIAGICKDLVSQSNADGQPWGDLCVTDDNGTPLRIVAPNIYLSDDGDAFSDYFNQYIDQVWSRFTSEPLTIDTQSDPGLVKCNVQGGNNLFCDGDNRSYSKPSAADIFGCNSGPFAIIDGDNAVHKAVVPRLCAAFNRGTFLQDGGNVQPKQPSSDYYQSNPNNHYSRIIHQYETDGQGYAFSYDDVNPDGENSAGLVAGPDPRLLHIVLGGIQ
ncbi:hypothetical protein PFICI_08446 [Pestalotiopsis fici W106-1]|uniref:GH64 domain-containing protein n=1 Tax=Pestalotiopsis fici (strain W106-1 / CGMCC3.15140) TaxID=1229662 RepID=W3X6A3_PESFW|nr:uncharacterized protein PFICI_08446 [Pestalotiopsis fici W106-1]ETS80917.1 hypothetical protein PFICI_08446 [Pestalotiopsis fici W106-1]